MIQVVAQVDAYMCCFRGTEDQIKGNILAGPSDMFGGASGRPPQHRAVSGQYILYLN